MSSTLRDIPAIGFTQNTLWRSHPSVCVGLPFFEIVSIFDKSLLTFKNARGQFLTFGGNWTPCFICCVFYGHHVA